MQLEKIQYALFAVFVNIGNYFENFRSIACSNARCRRRFDSAQPARVRNNNAFNIL
jgi:hypothetical protein